MNRDRSERERGEMITYTTISINSIRVYLDRERVGHIERTKDGHYWYVPNGQRKGGEEFNTVAEVKHSIEGQCR